MPRVRLQLNNDTAANWVARNPVLGLAEEGVETDTHRSKIGDGITPWNSLLYWSGEINISAGASSSAVSALTFSNGGGVSFGFDGSNVTATVATNYQSQGAYLTTADLSQNSSLYAGTVGAMVGGLMLLNTKGLTISLPSYLTTAQPPGNYLTTAMQSNAITLSNINVSGGTTSSLVSALTFSNGNGVSFGFDGSNVTATVATNYQSAGNYLTTAARFQDSSNYAGTGLAATGALVTLNTAGLSINVTGGGGGAGSLTISAGTLSAAVSAVTFSNANGVSFGFDGSNVTATVATNYQSAGAYLTTADLSQNSSKYAGINSGATNCSVTVNTSGVSVSVGNYLTTAMVSNAATISNINVSGSNTSANLSNLVFSNSNGVSFGLSGSTITATVATNYQSVGAYLTTADLSQNSSNYAGINSGATNCSVTVNTSGVSVSVGNYLTTAMVSNAATISNINMSAGTTSTNGSAFTFSNSNGISFGIGSGANAGIITGSIATNLSVVNFSAGANSANLGSVVFSNSNGISFGLNGSTITANAGVLSSWANMPYLPPGSTTLSASNSVLQIVPFTLPLPISLSYVRFPISMAAVSTSASTAASTANTSFTQNMSFSNVLVLYSSGGTGANSLSLQSITSTVATWVAQTSITNGAVGSQYTIAWNISYPVSGSSSNYATNVPLSNLSYQMSTGSLTLFTGPRWLDIPFATFLSAGNYWWGIGNSTATASNAGPSLVGGSLGMFSTIGASQSNLSFGLIGAATNASIQFEPWLGSFSTNAAILSTASVNMGNVSLQASTPRVYFQLINRIP